MNYPKVILSSGKDQSLKRFHPWVFSGAIKKIKSQEGKEIKPEEGAIVEVYSNHDEYLGTGHFQIGSIAIRIISFTKQNINQEFWNHKIGDALNVRKIAGLVDNSETNVYRLIHAEGDGLPGLIVDFYNGTAVIQSHSIGMHLAKQQITEALKTTLGNSLKAIYDKSEDTLPKQSAVKATNQILFGRPETNTVKENGHLFEVNWETGQKTGFFIDQRDNRALLSSFCKGKSVLNTFCYSGGFSVYALKAGASLVHSVDSSAKAIDLVNNTIQLNFGDIAHHTSFVSDTFDFMKDKKDVYDIIILDPPAFAKHQDVKHNAVQGYKRLNAEAIRLIKKGGILFTFSCSQAVDKYLFNSTIMSAAIQAGRNVRVLYQLHQPIDHAPCIFHPEGEYLKGLVLLVD